jgi:hypothetical protein
MHPPTATAEVSAHGLLAIDPGKSGGIAYMDSDHTVHALPMPDTARDLYRALEILARGPSICFLEEIPMFRGKMNYRSTAVLFRNLGQIEGVLSGLGSRIEYFKPQYWQRVLMLGESATYGKRWKTHLKAQAQALFPQLQVTLKTADALLILEAGLRTKRGMVPKTHAPAEISS